MSGPRRGFTLIEIMIALVIFSAVILALVGLSFSVAQRSTRATDQALAMAALLSKVAQANSTTFDSLGNIAGCDTSVTGLFKVVGCTNVGVVSAHLDSVQIIVETTLPGARPDTLSMLRSSGQRPVPLR
jgi:prepilin-type N-terminal cleavage/methylation domain-containing protein